MKRFSAATTEAKPWKNGGGLMREFHEQNDGTQVLWRFSLADITQDGAFSTFPGMSRALTIAKGHGVILAGGGVSLHANPGQPLAFDGARVLDSQLVNGPTQALNIMWNTNLVHAEVRVKQAGSVDLSADATTVAFVLKGRAELGGQSFAAQEGAIWETGRVTGHVADSAVLWIARIILR
ncbi:HutD/Ves family protein [Cochlodiniinecator piscidefendens]|uniref:HutD/Ves family protein n=1 Tax=Cochlodiniinecator piscidefendens TaxID=2715756 RepID=UPI00140770D6|nr:HutD family protein [Cochlodiniinecator piscidefendens]